MKMFNYKTSLFLFLLTVPQWSFAHAHLLEANPPANAILREVPSEVRIKFSEDLESSMSKIEVKNTLSHEVVSKGPSILDQKHSNILYVSLKPLKEENTTYEVLWKVVAKDGHKMKGLYQFKIERLGH